MAIVTGMTAAKILELFTGKASTTHAETHAAAGSDPVTLTAAQLSDLTETVQDIVGAFIVAGTNVTVSHNDAANTFTINATASGGGSTDPEIVRDVIGAAMVAGSGIQITVNDAGDTITVASTAVLPTRQVNAGTGLTGGGDLSANRTLSVSYGTTAGTSAQGNDSRIGKIGGTVAVSGTPTAGQVPIASSGTAAAWGTPSGGSLVAPAIADAATLWHTPGLLRLGFSDTLIATVPGTTYYFGPYVFTESHVLAKVQYNLASVTSANLRVALIAANPITLQPTGVAVTLPDVLHTTTGQKTIVLGSPATIPAGVYIVGFRADANLTLKGMISGSLHYASQSAESGYLTVSHRTVSQAYGTWGSPPTAFTDRSGGLEGLLIPFELGFDS